MNVWESIILFFSFQSFLIGVIFFFKNGAEAYANKILACFLFGFGFILFYNVMFWTKWLYTEHLIHFGQTYLIIQGLLAPIFFFYIRNVVDRQKVNLRKDFWHFLPAFLVLIACSRYYVQSAETKLAIYREGSMLEYVSFVIPPGITLVLIMVVYVGYIFWAYSGKFAGDADLKVWLRTISLSFLGCVLSYLLYYFLYYIDVLEVNHDYMITVVMALCVFWVSFFSFNQPEVFNGKPLQKRELHSFKYRRTNIADDLSSDIRERLLTLMKREKPHLQSDLRLDDLAHLLKVPRHHASQVINQHFQQNFNDFINSYRIEAAVQLLQDDRTTYSMKEIAYQVGFNNYVSFYKAFKKMTGQVPKEFKNINSYNS